MLDKPSRNLSDSGLGGDVLVLELVRDDDGAWLSTSSSRHLFREPCERLSGCPLTSDGPDPCAPEDLESTVWKTYIGSASKNSCAIINGLISLSVALLSARTALEISFQTTYHWECIEALKSKLLANRRSICSHSCSRRCFHHRQVSNLQGIAV